MITIINQKFNIEIEGKIKIETLNNMERNLDGNIIIDKNKPEKFIIEISGFFEYLYDLKIGEYYEISLDNNFLIYGKSNVKLDHKSKNIFIYKNFNLQKTIEFIDKGEVIQFDDDFSLVYNPILECCLLNYNYNDNYNTMIFEYIKPVILKKYN